MNELPSNNGHNENNQLATRDAIDLMAPTDRFVATSRLFGKLHRQQLHLRKYWWLLLLILLATLVPAYLISMATPRAYQSNARMWLTGKIDLSGGNLYTEELVNFLGTQADLLRSSVIQERALAALLTQLSNSPPLKPVPGTLDVVRRLTGLQSGSKNAEPDFPFRLKVNESSKSSILELHATGAEPKPTRAYLNVLMDEYLKFKRESRVNASDRAVTSLKSEVKGQGSRIHGRL